MVGEDEGGGGKLTDELVSVEPDAEVAASLFWTSLFCSRSDPCSPLKWTSMEWKDSLQDVEITEKVKESSRRRTS